LKKLKKRDRAVCIIVISKILSALSVYQQHVVKRRMNSVIRTLFSAAVIPAAILVSLRDQFLQQRPVQRTKTRQHYDKLDNMSHTSSDNRYRKLIFK